LEMIFRNVDSMATYSMKNGVQGPIRDVGRRL
jgi:hypothetical protein